jgi:hypothetical protein
MGSAWQQLPTNATAHPRGLPTQPDKPLSYGSAAPFCGVRLSFSCLRTGETPKQPPLGGIGGCRMPDFEPHGLWEKRPARGILDRGLDWGRSPGLRYRFDAVRNRRYRFRAVTGGSLQQGPPVAAPALKPPRQRRPYRAAALPLRSRECARARRARESHPRSGSECGRDR